MLFYSLISSTGCRDYLGKENRDIPDGIQASSAYSSAYAAWKARLNGPYTWCEISSGCIFSWIQANSGYQTSVSGVVTRGSGGYGGDYRVRLMKVSTFERRSEDMEIFITDDN